MDHLERARANLQRASERASKQVHAQLDSLQQAIGKEADRDADRDGPDSEIDRLAEVTDKLGGLEDQVEDPEVQAHIDDAVDHLREYMRDHPHGE